MNSGLTYIFDVDGTLTAHRYEKDEVRDVAPNVPILGVALAVFNSTLGKIAVVTARPHYLYEDTVYWLNRHGLFPDVFLTREPFDDRLDHEVRTDQVAKVMELMGGNVVLFDDKLTNCLTVKACLKVPCIHVREQ